MDAFAKGNIAVVTGGAGGIGFAVAKKLVGQGLRVVLVGRADTVLERATELGEGATDFIVDVSDRPRATAVSSRTSPSRSL